MTQTDEQFYSLKETVKQFIPDARDNELFVAIEWVESKGKNPHEKTLKLVEIIRDNRRRYL